MREGDSIKLNEPVFIMDERQIDKINEYLNNMHGKFPSDYKQDNSRKMPIENRKIE